MIPQRVFRGLAEQQCGRISLRLSLPGTVQGRLKQAGALFRDDAEPGLSQNKLRRKTELKVTSVRHVFLAVRPCQW
jgi:hypothetical protein